MSTRIVIVGGGAIGLMTAYRLAKEGAEVVLVDARATGRGAASVNAGWICPGESAPVPGPGMISKSLKWMLHRDSPLYIRPSLHPDFARFMFGMWRACTGPRQREGYLASLELARASETGFEEFRDDGMEFDLRQQGLLLAFSKQESLSSHLANLDVAQRYGLDPKVLIGDDVRVQEPMLTDKVFGGIYFPKERHLDPNKLMQRLDSRLRELGVNVVQDAPVDRVERNGERVTAVRSGDRRFEGDRFLIAAGAWTGKVTALFGNPLPIRPGKGYSVDVPALPLRTATNLSDAKVAVTPLADRLRLAGTMEFAGLDEERNRVRIEAILRAPASYFREWRVPPVPQVNPRAGLRPMTPDGLPVIGPLGDLTNVVVSSGHGMMGITLGPGSASAVADLMLRDQLHPVLEPFSPARFGPATPRAAA